MKNTKFKYVFNSRALGVVVHSKNIPNTVYSYVNIVTTVIFIIC